MDTSFTEQDKQKVIEFLNSVAKFATFNMNTQELISYFKQLSFMQQTLLPKIEAHIFELKEVTTAKEEENV